MPFTIIYIYTHVKRRTHSLRIECIGLYILHICGRILCIYRQQQHPLAHNDRLGLAMGHQTGRPIHYCSHNSTEYMVELLVGPFVSEYADNLQGSKVSHRSIGSVETINPAPCWTIQGTYTRPGGGGSSRVIQSPAATSTVL